MSHATHCRAVAQKSKCRARAAYPEQALNPSPDRCDTGANLTEWPPLRLASPPSPEERVIKPSTHESA
eukprot:2292916-Amphidinium_carterae.1